MLTKYPYSALALELYSTIFTNMASAPFCHDVRTLDYPIGRPRLSIVAPAYRFAIGHPLKYIGLLLATGVSTGLILSLPHSAVSAHSVTRSGNITVLSLSVTSRADVR